MMTTQSFLYGRGGKWDAERGDGCHNTQTFIIWQQNTPVADNFRQKCAIKLFFWDKNHNVNLT